MTSIANVSPTGWRDERRTAPAVRLLALATTVLAVGFAAGPVWAIEVEEVLWGFDGRIVANQFNPLSVRIRNTSAQPQELTFELRRRLGGYRPVGALIRQEDIVVAPNTERWVQFYPYVIGQWEEWRLMWGDGAEERHDLPKPKAAGAATVLLVDPDELPHSGGQLKRFPEQLFPPYVTASSGLAAVVLDHVPVWQKPRRDAFLDWLFRGGTVHVIQNDKGRYPDFPAELAALNDSSGGSRVGAGRVVRHELMRKQLDRQFVESVLVATHKEPDSRTFRSSQFDDQFDLVGDEDLFDRLRSMTRSGRAWLLIYLISGLYVLMVCPGCYLFGRRGLDWRRTFAALFATVAVFSVIFWLVGRRDDEGTMTIRSVAIARPLRGAAFDVMQWSDAAVSAGGEYAFEHEGSGRLYSDGQQFELVRGTIINGAGGRMTVDIPPYSSRTFCHRMTVELDPLDARVVDVFPATGALKQLDVAPGAHFPDDVRAVFALVGGTLYRLKREGTLWRLDQQVGTIFDGPAWRSRGLTYSFDPEYDEYQEVYVVFQTLCRSLIVRSLCLDGRPVHRAAPLPEDRIRLFIYAPMPDRLRMLDDNSTSQVGFVLYCLDVPRPDAP